jgi:hypothetical protein
MREPSSIIEPHVLAVSAPRMIQGTHRVAPKISEAASKSTATAPASTHGPENGTIAASVTAAVLVVAVGGAGVLSSGRSVVRPTATVKDVPALNYRELTEFELRPSYAYPKPAPLIAKVESTSPIAAAEPIPTKTMQAVETPPPQNMIDSALPQNFSSTSVTIRTQEASSLFFTAEPKILGHLRARSGQLTLANVEKVLRSDLADTIAKAASRPNSGITFEALTGKLTIDSSKYVGGIKITAGEVNVYKVSVMLAGGVAACSMFTKKKSFSNCIKAAFAKVETFIAKQMELLPTSAVKDVVTE